MLGAPDDQSFTKQNETYEALIEHMHALTIADAPAQRRERVQSPFQPSVWVCHDLPGEGQGRILTLDGQLVEVQIRRYGDRLSIEPGELAASGTSGSPIFSLTGDVMGVICLGEDGNPVLMDCLPGRFLRIRRKRR